MNKMGNREVFPMGFWNYTPTGVYGIEAVKDWKDCGMTVTMSPGYDPSLHKKEDFMAILDECQRQGIKLIVCDKRAYWMGAMKDPQKYKEQFQACYDDFGGHEAVFGFHVGDEPSGDAVEEAKLAINIQSEIAPEKNIFLNFLPYWDGIEQVLKIESFDAEMSRFAKEAKLRQFCYDCYTQMNPGEEGYDLYFKNLRKYSSLAKEAGLPFWTTLLSVGHFRYRVPKEDDIRWQLYTALANGAKGILWFLFYMNGTHNNYRLAPMDEHFERTETYTYLSRQLRTFHINFADLFLHMELEKSYHFVKAYGGFDNFENRNEDEYTYISNVHSEHGLPGILSIFRHSDGSEYVAIVNNSQCESGLFRISFGNEIKRVFRRGWKGREDDMELYHHDAMFDRSNDKMNCGVWLAPGQMDIFRLER